MIAKEFDVSLPTVKRWYSGQGLSLEQASDLCHFLGLTLGEALHAIQKTTQTFLYTLEQEKFFAKNPDTLAFFDNLLRGKSLKSMRKKFRLSSTKMTDSLLKLDRLKLIELHPNNKFKLLKKGEPIWRPSGPLQVTFRSQILEDFLGTKKCDLDRFLLYEFSDDDAKAIQLKLLELQQLASTANRRSALANSKAKSYGLMLSLKEFKWSIDQFLN